MVVKNHERELSTYWHFRATNVLKQMFLHFRRRTRLLLAFGFLRYKANAYQRKAAILNSLAIEDSSPFRLTNDFDEDRDPLASQVKRLADENVQSSVSFTDTTNLPKSANKPTLSAHIIRQNQIKAARRIVNKFLLLKHDNRAKAGYFRKWAKTVRDMERFVVREHLRRVSNEVE